jgi:hypothetical protein
MSKFKVGDNIVRINDAVYGQRAGFKAIVDANYCYESPYSVRYKIIDENWELSKPKWTIYNNTLPWSDLSDKQKGKMLLAAHSGVLFKMHSNGQILDSVRFITNETIYQGVEPIKQEPTMAELFDADMGSFDFRGSLEVPEYMISKGWVKK